MVRHFLDLASNTTKVINCIIVLGNTVKQKDSYKGPVIEDASKTKDLWSESLIMNELKEDGDADSTPVRSIISATARLLMPSLQELGAEERELVAWVNSQLAKSAFPIKQIRNLSSSVRSGVALMRLVEVSTHAPRHNDNSGVTAAY